MNVPASREAVQSQGEDRDKPIPVSERYRKSFVATLTWSSFACLLALGSCGQDQIVLALTQMKYPTWFAVSASCVLAVYWFCQFFRAERMLSFASSEFAFGNLASDLAESLEKFRQKVILKTAEIEMMKSVNIPDISDGRLVFSKSEVLLRDFLDNLNSTGINVAAGDLQGAIRQNYADLEKSSSENLMKSLGVFLGSINEKSKEVSNVIQENIKLSKIWEERDAETYKVGSAALVRLELETKEITEAADRINSISSQISLRDVQEMRALEYWPARIMLAAACLAAGYNIGHEFMRKQVLTCAIGKRPIFCVPLEQKTVPAIFTQIPRTPATK